MASITWDNTEPSNTTEMQYIPNAVRDTKVQIATGLGESFYWPGSAASQGASAESAGEMLPGSGRMLHFEDTDNINGGNAPNGYLGLIYRPPTASTRANSNVYVQHVGSENTHLIASTGIEEVVAVMDIRSATVNQAELNPNYRWVVDEGNFLVSEDVMGEFNEAVAFTVTYDVPPFVFMSVDSAAMTFGADQVTTTGFVSRGSSFGGANPADPGSVLVWWRSEGTVSYV